MTELEKEMEDKEFEEVSIKLYIWYLKEFEGLKISAFE